MLKCCIIHPVQSFHLQILEKGSQQFDGMVGQDNRQNSKPLVSWREKKISPISYLHTYFKIKPYSQK